jgi:hypothetical protein
MYIERIIVYIENVPVFIEVGADYLASSCLGVMKISSL